jgi:flagellar L-ring protein precursor FlgH
MLKHLMVWFGAAGILAGAVCAQKVPHNYSLFSDKRSKGVDDIVTVLVMESAQARNRAMTDNEKSSRIGMQSSAGTGAADFVPGFGVSNESSVDFRGIGRNDRSGTLKAKVTARVIRVLDNGNLVVQGQKEVEMNKEKEILQVSGIIRPEDIMGDNTVYSFNIAEAHIAYVGNGVMSSSANPGFLTRFFNWLF